MPRGADTIAATANAPVRSNGARALPKRRALPNGRAALGGLLVAASVVVLFSVAEARGATPLQRFVVADDDLALGQRITAGDLRTAGLHVPTGGLRGRVFTDPEALIGAVVIAPVAEGELIQASAVLADSADPGFRHISVPVDAGRSLGDRLQPGELVDVVATFGTGGDAFTVSVVKAARVVERDADAGPLGDRRGQVIVLAVTTDADAMAIAHAVAAGQLSLVRVSGAADDNATTPDPYRAPRPGAGR